MERLQELLKDPRYQGLVGSKKRLTKALRGQVEPDVIADYFARSEAHQVRRIPAKKTKETQYVIAAPPLSFQMDVGYFNGASLGNGGPRINGGNTCALMLVEILSRKVFAYPMKTHTMPEILDHYERFLSDLGRLPDSLHQHPRMVMADDEFNVRAFKEYNDELGVKVFTGIAADDHRIGNSNRLGVIDGIMSGLKGDMSLQMEVRGKQGRWAELLPVLVQTYNDKTENAALFRIYHISMSPNQAFHAPETSKQSMYTQMLFRNTRVALKNPKFEVDDAVRVLKDDRRDSAFARSRDRWDPTVRSVVRQEGYKYAVTGKAGLFKPQEMQKVTGTPILPTPQQAVPREARPAAERARRIIRSRKEGIAPDENVLAGNETARRTRPRPEPAPTPALKPKETVPATLAQAKLKQGEMIALKAWPDEDRGRLTFTKRGKTAYCWVAWVVPPPPKAKAGNVYIQSLGSTAVKGRLLSNPELTLGPVEGVILRATPLTSLLFRSADVPMPTGPYGVPADVRKTIITAYRA